VPWGALGKNVFAECRAQEALGKICFQKIKKNCRVSKNDTRQSFKKKKKTNFAECPASKHSAKKIKKKTPAA